MTEHDFWVMAAELAHEVNRIYSQTLGDDSHPLWEDAPEWQRSSAMSGIGHAFDDPNLSPRNSHALWLEKKLDDGWKYGPVKDVEKKEHPCCVPYDDLPEEQRAKDVFFLAIAAVVRKYELATRKAHHAKLVEREAARYGYEIPEPPLDEFIHSCGGIITADAWFAGVDVPKVDVRPGVLVRLFIQGANGLLMDAGIEPHERGRILNLDPRSDEMRQALRAAADACPESVYVRNAILMVEDVAKSLGPLEASDA